MELHPAVALMDMVLFEYDPAKNIYIRKCNFKYPETLIYIPFGLVAAPNGKLYGVADRDGTNGYGAIFEYTPGEEIISIKYNFVSSAPGGELCYSSVTNSLYGSVRGLGSIPASIYEYTLPTPDLPNGVVKTIADFKSSIDLIPLTRMVESGNGKLYGTALLNHGALFEFDPTTQALDIKHNFKGLDGRSPGNALLVIKSNQTINFDAIAEKNFDQQKVQLSAYSDSGLPISYISSDPAIAKISGTTVEFVSIGSVTITATQSGNSGYYQAVNKSQTLIISKGNQVINFSALEAKRINDTPFSLIAKASSGLAVSYSSSNTDVAKINGITVTIIGTGNTMITASQSGSAEYNSASEVSQLLTITKIVVDPVTGLEMTSNTKLLIYPNPVDTKLFINCILYKIKKLVVTTSLGQDIVIIENPTEQLEIEASSWNAGIYILKIETTFGNAVYKIIK